MESYWVVKGNPRDSLESVRKAILKGKIVEVAQSTTGNILITVRKPHQIFGDVK